MCGSLCILQYPELWTGGRTGGFGLGGVGVGGRGVGVQCDPVHGLGVCVPQCEPVQGFVQFGPVHGFGSGFGSEQLGPVQGFGSG